MPTFGESDMEGVLSSALSVDVLLGVSGALAGRHERKVQSGRLRGQTDIRGL